jgi:death on curing protein
LAVKYLELADFLLIAEAVTGTPAEALARSDRTVHLAESALAAPAAAYGGQEFYRDIATKAAILCARLVRNHPLLDGNKRVAFLCMVEFLARNGHELATAGKRAQDTLADVVVSLAAGEASEADFAALVKARLR